MIYFADCIRSYFIVLSLLFFVAEGADLEVPEPAIRANRPGCSKPAGSIGDSFVQKCLKMTCTRKGRRGFWKESFASDKCCNYNQKGYEIGQHIKQTLSTNDCYMINIYCAKNRASEPEIKIDIDDQCANINDVEALLKIHSNNSKENIQKMSDNIVNLLQIFLNKTEKPALPEVTYEPQKTNPKPDTTTTTTTSTTKPTTTETYDSEVLFIGPGSGSKGQSEVLSIPLLTIANCTPPTFPSSNYGYVATMTVDGPVLCGGAGAGADCYLLTRSGTWLGTPPMKAMQASRAYAAAAKLGNGWWVTGGYVSGKSIATTEIWSNQSWHSYTNLPTALCCHCLVELNSTHFFLTGGLTGNANSAASYIFSEEKGFVKQADMITARRHHACSLHADSLVFVAGGYDGSSSLQKTEYFSLLTMTWLPGPDLPVATHGGKMLSMNGKTVFIGGNGNKKIFQLEKLGGLSTVDWWKWIKVGEMKTARSYFDVVKMKMEDCKYWNSLKMIQ